MVFHEILWLFLKFYDNSFGKKIWPKNWRPSCQYDDILDKRCHRKWHFFIFYNNKQYVYHSKAYFDWNERKAIIFFKKNFFSGKWNDFFYFGTKMTLFTILMTSSEIMTSWKNLWRHFVPYMAGNISAKFHQFCISISKVIGGGSKWPPPGLWFLKKARPR